MELWYSKTKRTPKEPLMITRLYPNGKRKAFVLTYDDGVLQDVRLVLLLNRYGLKGTFNLNSLLMEREFATCTISTPAFTSAWSSSGGAE